MRILRPSSEDEMVAVFLGAEIDSERFGEEVRGLLAQTEFPERVVREPDLADAEENAWRRRALDAYRAYDRRDGLFGGFPRDVRWSRAVLTREELLGVHYIAWDWWLRLSAGSCRPADAARRIRAGEIAGVTAEEHEPFAVGLHEERQVELIVVTTPARSRLVVLEGHVRLTAYALFPERVPAEVEVLLGVSPGVADWWAFWPPQRGS